MADGAVEDLIPSADGICFLCLILFPLADRCRQTEVQEESTQLCHEENTLVEKQGRLHTFLLLRSSFYGGSTPILGGDELHT